MKKRIVLNITILTLIIYILINVLTVNRLYAVQYLETYNANEMQNYSGYRELIEEMKARHPNWNFTIFYTGLDWNQVIKNETTASHGRNVVPASRTSAWKCSSCGETPRGGSSWRCASEAAVAYYMDPRNWINDTYIFQFETLSFNGNIQTVEGVQEIISNVRYMQGDTVQYTNIYGNTETLYKSYAQLIWEAARDANISPYHLASRLKQEQGTQRPGSTATGTYGGYVGYYNFMNIGATGDTDSEVIANGLQYAMDNGWTNPQISITEGAKILASRYIGRGQDTLYLQKFDVDNSDGTLYWHQYMQNVSVCLTEGASARSAYEELGFLDSSIDFQIPVYENMPFYACPEPSEDGIVTQNVRITGNTVRIREGKSTSSEIIITVDSGFEMLRIEMANSTNENIYWDKVVLPDGTKAYVSRDYIEQIADRTNCNDTVITTTSVNLRNGPGIDGTTIVSTLIKDQILTRIETGKYNLDGYIWDRVKLSDGREGYIAQNYITKTEELTVDIEIVQVICNSGLKVREYPGTSENVLTAVAKNSTLTRVQAGVSNADGYIWDKIITAEGIEGYIARGDAQEDYIEVISTTYKPNPTPEPTPIPTPVPTPQPQTEQNDNIKIEEQNLICEPGTTIESIKGKYQDIPIIVKNIKGEETTTGKIGTGWKIIINGIEYSVIKLGDINGDGEINTGDSFMLKKHVMQVSNITI